VINILKNELINVDMSKSTPHLINLNIYSCYS